MFNNAQKVEQLATKKGKLDAKLAGNLVVVVVVS